MRRRYSVFELHLPLLFPNRLNIFVIPCVVLTEERMWISSRVDVLDSGFVFDRKVPELISLNMWAGCLSQTITVGIFLMAFVTVRQVSWHRERCNFQRSMCPHGDFSGTDLLCLLWMQFKVVTYSLHSILYNLWNQAPFTLHTFRTMPLILYLYS